MNTKNLSVAFYIVGIINGFFSFLLFDISNNDIWGNILLILFLVIVVMFNHLYLQYKIINKTILGAIKGALIGALIASALFFISLFYGGGLDSLWDLILGLYGLLVALLAIIGAMFGVVFRPK
ncbi:MAG: hypothetical protein AAB586_02565 [Patescibacteria group bacterium]|mgnify:CR=1 FL=1